MFRKGTTLKITMTAALSIASAATALPMAAIARADVLAVFSHRREISAAVCVLVAMAEVVSPRGPGHTWAIVALTPNCGSASGAWEFDLHQGNPPGRGYSCAAGSLVDPGEQMLDYGQTRSVGTITCDSETSGMTCTRHQHRALLPGSRESCQLG
jgi:hypothetical protein